MIFSISLQLIEKWISGVISGRNDGKPADQTQVTLIWAIAVSIFCVGGMVGGLSTGFVAEKFGRKGGLLVSNALVILSAALQGKAKIDPCIILLKTTVANNISAGGFTLFDVHTHNILYYTRTR